MEYVDVLCVSDSCRRVKRFHRHNVLGMLQMVGIKHAAEVSDAVFARLRALRLSAAAPPLPPTPSAAAKTAFSSTSASIIDYADFEAAVSDAIEEHMPAISPSSATAAAAAAAAAKSSDDNNLQHAVAVAVATASASASAVATASASTSATSHVRCFRTAFRLRDRSRNIILLLGGTSGCGKSTLASLAGSRLSISTVLSTDNIRHVLRHFYPKSELPVLWTSSYYAGTALQADCSGPASHNHSYQQVIEGYEAQNACVFEKIEEIVARFAERKESLVLEGVHLSTKNILALVRKYPCCVPFVVYISNKSKHAERFAVRARYMTLEPRENKYIKYFANIRKIQSYLVEGARRALIPTVNNTNVDRSLSALHRTILNVLTRTEESGESLYDEDTGKLHVLHDEYDKVCAQGWGSKAMLEQIILSSGERRAGAGAGAAAEPAPTSLSNIPKSCLASSASNSSSTLRLRNHIEQDLRLPRCRKLTSCDDSEGADGAESELSETSIADMNEDALRIGSLGS